MTDAPRGTSGDRRRNPFPSFTDTEYELFMATIREEARIGPRLNAIESWKARTGKRR